MLQQLDEQTSAAQTDHEKQLCHVGYIHLHGTELDAHAPIHFRLLGLAF